MKTEQSNQTNLPPNNTTGNRFVGQIYKDDTSGHPRSGEAGWDRLYIFAETEDRLSELINKFRCEFWEVWIRDNTGKISAVMYQPQGVTEPWSDSHDEMLTRVRNDEPNAEVSGPVEDTLRLQEAAKFLGGNINVSRSLEFEPYYGTPLPWGARGVLGDKYWARDNGKWHSDPDNSGPAEEDVKACQVTEDHLVRALLSQEARDILMKGLARANRTAA